MSARYDPLLGSLVTDQVGLVATMTGDSGSGGVKGLVPAPSSGDAAAGKFLKSDATWAVPAASPVPQHFSTIDGHDASTATRFDASKVTAGTGSVSMATNNNYTLIATGATANSHQQVKAHASNSLNMTNGYLTTPQYFSYALRIGGSSGTGQLAWGAGGFDMSSGSLSGLSGYANYLFKSIIASGTETASYTQSNASAATTATVTFPSSGFFNIYTAVHNGTNVKYYCNKTLLATVTGNLPASGSNFGLNMAAGNASTANDIRIELYEALHSMDAY